MILFVLALPAAQLIPLDEKAYVRMLRLHHGKVVLVDFWATWCAPCREELPRLVTLSKKLGSEKFKFVAISADEPEKAAAVIALLNKEGLRSPLYIKQADDDQVFIDSVDKKWSGALPALFLYDRSGARIVSFIGEFDPADVEAAVRKALHPQIVIER